ncbi:MAG: response regulator [Campylobacterales bacterium]|nr:response regulator [Campylobacterales bacterium]
MVVDLGVEYQMIMLLLIGGLISGSAVSLSSRIEMFYVYILLTLIPFIYVLYLGDSKAYNILAASASLYMIVVILMSKKIANNTYTNIILAYEKQDLISELKNKVQEANIANKAKSEFLSVMSHEIRTPLNAIIGFVQILLRTEKDPKKVKYLNTVNDSSKVLTNIINDILDISKIESGKFTLEAIPFNPKDEFESLYQLFKPNANEKNLNFKFNISKDMPQTLSHDILRIKQIISNLLSNAIKFTPSDKNIELNISFNKQNSSLHCEIKDEGIGIAKENIKKITEVFTQADSSTTRKYGGSGLGLAIVTKLLKLFDSELKIESELDKGSVFSFDIKMVVLKESILDTQEQEDCIFENKKVLIAEDNAANQLLIKLILEELNIHSVVIAQDGLEVEEMFQKDTFDIVLMDINMPNKNGTEAMLAIKEYEKKLNINPTPIVALTANAVSGDREKYIKQGFDNYLAKPIDIKELTKILNQYIA